MRRPRLQLRLLTRAWSIGQAVEQHLQRYFALFDGDLPPAGLYDRILAEVEHPLILACMTATRGNQIKAAELLGLNRNTLRKKNPRTRRQRLSRLTPRLRTPRRSRDRHFKIPGATSSTLPFCCRIATMCCIESTQFLGVLG